MLANEKRCSDICEREIPNGQDYMAICIPGDDIPIRLCRDFTFDSEGSIRLDVRFTNPTTGNESDFEPTPLHGRAEYPRAAARNSRGRG